MNWYPQLNSGASHQFPIRRIRKWRTIVNKFEDGEQVMYADSRGGTVEWKLRYTELQESEVAALRALFTASKGRADSFGFLDPLVNLLAGSEDLSRPEWRAGLMTLAGGVADPNGGATAWRVTNGSAGPQDLAQTLGFPATTMSSFSMYLRSDAAAPVMLLRDGKSLTIPVGPQWQRHFVSLPGDTDLAISSFSLRLTTGQILEAWGFQVEAQPFPSQYQKSLTAVGIYRETSFAMDELSMVATSPGLWSCEISLVSRG